MLGNVFSGLGRIEEAINDFINAIYIDPQHAKAFIIEVNINSSIIYARHYVKSNRDNSII